MKVLYIETMILGHHVPYIHALANTDAYESVIITPERINCIGRKQIIYPKMDFESKKITDYKACIRCIEKIADEECVDIIHFLDGDKIMRYFGMGMKTLSDKYPVVITFHHLFEGIIRRISYMLMCKNTTAVVHTAEFKRVLNRYEIKNVFHIEYPSFLHVPDKKIQNTVPVIGMFGGTRYEKGLDILVAALRKVETPFHLIIAGREADYKKCDIEKMCEPIKEKVTLDLHFLSEDELATYWDKTDLVVLPYRAMFDGASGQLTEGVNRGLPIIGPSHGSLGNIITENHLGITFKTGDWDDLAQKIEIMLRNKFIYDDIARKYQDMMKPERFNKDYKKLYDNVLK